MLAPPYTLHSPSPPVLAGVWSVNRETLLTGSVLRHYKEAVAAAVSRSNECPYCLDAHTMTLHGVAEHRVANAISKGQHGEIEDEKLRSLVDWAAATRTPDAEILRSPPFTRREAPEIIGTAVGFHYINRMANVFLDESPLPLPSILNGARGALKRMAGWMMKANLHLDRQPGESLQFVPEADLPDDSAWAASNPAVAGAVAGFSAVIEQVSQTALPEPARALVCEQLQTWNGEPPGFGRHWVEEATAGLDEVSRPAARLALLTALASYQVDESVIEAYRAQHPGDDKLIEVTAWASFIAAQRIGTWLHIEDREWR